MPVTVNSSPHLPVVEDTALSGPEIPQPASDDTKPRFASDSFLVNDQPVNKLRGGSYFTRHWRGELSLPVSYWINGTLLSIGFSLVLTSVSWDDFVSKSPKVYSATVIGIWVLLALATIWQFVGIWRSANNYVRERRENLWGKLAKILVVVGLIASISKFASTGVPQITEYAKIAAGKDPLGIYQLRVLRDATELEIAGAIIFGLTEDLSRTLVAHPTIHIIHLNSQGGRVSEARNLRNLLTARGLTTYTASGCFSACTVAYAAGKQRLIAKDARLGFHQYSFPGMKQQDFQLEYEKDKRDWLARGFEQAFVNRAFNTPNNEMWKPTHQELYEAGFITGYPDTNDVAITGFQINDWENFETEVSKQPLFAALKTYEPKIYGQWVLEIQVGLQQGKSQAELRNKIFPLAVSIYKQRLPYASDSVVRSVTSLLLEQMKVLYSVDPALCYEYLFGNDENHGFDATKYFTQEMIKKDSSIMAEVIRSAAGQRNRPPKEEQIQEQLKNVIAALAQRYGGDVSMLANPKQGKANKARMCQLTYDAYDTIMLLPERESGPLLRFMFASAK